LKATIATGPFGGRIEVDPEKAVISSENHDFFVCMEEIQDPAIKRLIVSPLDIQIEQIDGWIVHISRETPKKGYLIVTRFKRPKEGGPLINEYLTVKGEWLPCSPGYDSYPSDIMKIPIPTLEMFLELDLLS